MVFADIGNSFSHILEFLQQLAAYVLDLKCSFEWAVFAYTVEAQPLSVPHCTCTVACREASEQHLTVKRVG